MSKITKPIKKAANSLLFSLFSGNYGPKRLGYNGSLRKSPFLRRNDVSFCGYRATVLAGASHLAPTAIVDRLPPLREDITMKPFRLAVAAAVIAFAPAATHAQTVVGATKWVTSWAASVQG